MKIIADIVAPSHTSAHRYRHWIVVLPLRKINKKQNRERDGNLHICSVIELGMGGNREIVDDKFRKGRPQTAF